MWTIGVGKIIHVHVQSKMKPANCVSYYAEAVLVIQYHTFICLAGAIRELCKARDSGIVQFVNRNQVCNMIEFLCTR